MELSPERQQIADEAKLRLRLPGIEAVKSLFIIGEPTEESGEGVEAK